MKYSIRGLMKMSDGTEVNNLLNNYTLWRLVTNQTTNQITQEEQFSFEAWVNTEEDKNTLFQDLKPYVDEFGESISWHECTHDEESPQPCVIAEEYRGA